jgi:hypothetical protein
LRRLRVLVLLPECRIGPLVGNDDPTAVHLPGAEQLRPPRPLADAWCRVLCGRGRCSAASDGPGDGTPDGEVAVLLRVVVEPRQLCDQPIMREEGEASCEGAEESTNLWAEALSCRRRRLGCEVSLGRRGDWRGRCSRLDGPKLCRPTYPQNRLFLFAETFGATHRPGPFTKLEQPVEHSDFGLQLKGGRRGGPVR